MKSIQSFLYLILIVVFFPQPVSAVYFKNISVKDGLSQLSVISMHQDVLGRIWFGTAEGLSIYDGREMITLKGGDAIFDQFIKNNTISCIVENAAHDLFFMADDALIAYKFDQDKFRRIRENDVTSVSSIRGGIYVTVRDSILLWDEEHDQLQFFMEAELGAKNASALYQDSACNWWIGTNKGLYKKDHSQWVCVIPNTEIWGIYESRAKELWIASQAGMYRIDQQGTQTKFVHDPTNPNSICCDQVRKILEDRQGNLWIGTFKGLNKYSPKTNRFELYVEGNTAGNLGHSSIHSLMMDRQGDIWVGTYYGGANLFSPGREAFCYYPADFKGVGRLDFHIVGNMVEDKRHDLWICTDGGGLNCMNRETKLFQSYNMARCHLKSDNLKSICYDSANDKLYFALYRNGVTCYDLVSGRFLNCLKETDKDFSYRNIRKVCMYDGHLLFLSESGAFLMNTQNNEIAPLFVERNCQNLLVDSKDWLWILHGCEVIRINMRNTKDVKRFDLKSVGIEHRFPLSICEAANGGIYVGTQGSGVLEYNKQTDQFSVYTALRNGLLNDYCYSMANSKSGMLILLGDKGLSFFNPKTKKVDSVVMTQKLPVSAFNDGNGLFVADNGDIYVGSTSGLIVFSEEEVRASTKKEMSLFYSALYVNNAKVTPGDETGILSRIISYTKQITLSHNQNNLTFVFANNDFGNTTSSPFYEYQLEGFDKNWMPCGNVHRLIYTNLNPGEYTLRVREVNRYGDKSAKEIQMAIVIRSPFYNTPLAWILYILSATTILYIILSGRYRQMKLKTSLEYERREKEQLEELSRFKLEFFTNISHELRTPLTLIITQVELLMGYKEFTHLIQKKISKLYKHAFQMRNLISELLDFHKLEQGQIQLNVCVQNIIPFLNDIHSSFQEQAVAQDIQYTITSTSDSVLCCFDGTQLKKVFFNLLSNAFKYIGKGRTIELLITEEAEDVVVRVIDAGVGIGNEDIVRIFDRFYQASGKKENFSSGIGLSLCKDIVTLHHGEIAVESTLGYGSIFIVRLRKRAEQLQNDPKITFLREEETGLDSDSLPDSEFMELLHDRANVGVADQQEQKKHVILIVEDDEDLLSLLSDIFSPLYQVINARNGKEGWQMAMEKQPCIILSDVMMPEMSGTEMCAKVKNNIKTCHIPVVLLTARTTSEQHIEGLLTGADDYVTKPFHAKILLLKVNTLLRNREMLQGTFQHEPELRLELLGGNELDQKLLRKIEEIVEACMENPEFDVDALAQQAGMGRSVCFEKIKALTGMTPANFILVYRLRRAATLLLKYPKLQLNDLAAQIGFSSGRYFGRCFKNYFNVTPQQYREQNVK